MEALLFFMKSKIVALSVVGLSGMLVFFLLANMMVIPMLFTGQGGGGNYYPCLTPTVQTTQQAAGQTSGAQGSATPTPTSCFPPGSGKGAVYWALLMAAHLHGNPPCLACSPDVYYDSGFPQSIIQYGEKTCPGCSAWQNYQFQCVVFVLAAYAFVHPFPMAGNANVWWGEYAHEPGYAEIPAAGAPLGERGLPVPGDVMAWDGGLDGHVTIVIQVVPPVGGQNGSVTFANANGQMPIQTLPLRPDLTVDTNNGYWNGFTVMGYIRLISR